MPSQVGVANRAITKIGGTRILAMSDDTVEGRAVNHMWEYVRDSELRARNWNFAIGRESLAALVSTPVYGFDNEYQLPSDFLRLLDIDDSWAAAGLTDYRNSEETPFRIEGTKILTDLDAPLKIRYIKRITEVGSWDLLFCEVMACRLALELCEEVTQSNTKKQLLAAEYKDAVRVAQRANAIENPPQPLPDDSWVLSRL